MIAADGASLATQAGAAAAAGSGVPGPEQGISMQGGGAVVCMKWGAPALPRPSRQSGVKPMGPSLKGWSRPLAAGRRAHAFCLCSEVQSWRVAH